MVRALRWVFGALLVATIGAAFLLAGIRKGPGLPTGERVLAGLDGPVEVLWDSVGIPHVWASTPRDAFFAQGYLHGSHRLWQVEMFRRVARGRLSEVFGVATLETDRFLRTLGMDRAAAAGRGLLDPEAQALLQGYTEGLNAAVEGWEGLLPPEFLVLRTRPEPFTLNDVLALEKIMAWDLADYGSSLDLAEAWSRLGPEGFDAVRPAYRRDGLTILQSAGVEEDGAGVAAVATRTDLATGSARTVRGVRGIRGVRGNPPGRGGTSSASTGLHQIPRPTPELVASALRPRNDGYVLLEAVTGVRASNSWVVGPSRSASGKPLLANDMHLALNQPTLWYLVGLHAPGLNVVGMSLPGAAGIVAGHSDAVAWGFTNAVVDDTELYLERVDPADPDRYLTPDGSEPFQIREEIIRIRGGGADTLRVRSTRHGPVITSVEERTRGELLSLRWVGLDPSTAPGALLAMNRAGSAEAFLEALSGFTDPHQNVVFADTAGSWGYWMAGRIPDRPSPRPPLVPVPGWTGEADWRGYLPFREHPHALNPPSGFVATANNRQSWGGVADRISGGVWAPPYRAERITELLEARTHHDAASLHAIQMDVTSLQGLRYQEVAAEAFRGAGAPEEAEILAKWDGKAEVDSRAPLLFYAWFETVRDGLREEIYGEPRGYLPEEVVERALDQGPSRSFLAGAARQALDRVGDARWGEEHRLSLDHPLARIPLLGRLMGFGTDGIPRAGAPHTVNVADYRGGEPFFAVRGGPSQRHVVDMADPDGSGGFILPGGQSGFPGDPHALDQLPRWLHGGLVPLPLKRKGVEARTVERLVLRPAG